MQIVAWYTNVNVFHNTFSASSPAGLVSISARQPSTRSPRLVSTKASPPVAPSDSTNPPSDLTTTRRLNLLSEFREFSKGLIDAEEQPKGLDAAFAAKLQISGTTWSMAKSGSRPIGEKLARQFEVALEKPAYWLDEPRTSTVVTEAEQRFLNRALEVWRGTNSAGRKRLARALEQAASGSDPV
jgi:hypothetical protein